jgi:hypothetical protein
MNLRHVASCGLACAVLFLAGCDEGRQPPGKVGVRVVNVAPGFEMLAFQRGRPTHSMRCRSRAPPSPSTTGTLRLRLRARAQNERGAAAGRSRRARLDHSYAFVLTEVGGEVQPLIIEPPRDPRPGAIRRGARGTSHRPWTSSERPGVGIASAAPQLQRAKPIAPRVAGRRLTWLTATGDPANLARDDDITLPAG